MIRKLALPTVLLAALVLPAAASAAPRMEFALQDDAVFVDQRWMARDKALEHARDLGTKRIRVNILWARSLVSGADHRTPPADGPQYDFSKRRRAAGGRRGARHQAPVDPYRSCARVGDQGPQGRRQPARPGQVRRLRADRRRPLQGPRGPLLRVERAEPQRLARPEQDRAQAVPHALQDRATRRSRPSTRSRRCCSASSPRTVTAARSPR